MPGIDPLNLRKVFRMSNIKIPKSWEIPEHSTTPEEVFINRRHFLRKMKNVGIGALAIYATPGLLGFANALVQNKSSSTKLGPEFSSENIVTRYNNFYEFGTDNSNIWRMAEGLRTENWTIKVSGLVKKPQTLDVNAIIKQIPSEERVYRLRCVETWTVTVPWLGFSLHHLIKIMEPLSTARYVKFQTFLKPNLAAGQKQRFWEPWPYMEGLSMKEAMHDLTLMATGMYGKPLTPQNGAPIRLVVPWKYGFKSIKSINAIEFTKGPPETFWQTVAPLEYDFWANVEPEKPYARWHQSVERVLGEDRTIPTRLYNGYAKQVGGLYL